MNSARTLYSQSLAVASISREQSMFELIQRYLRRIGVQYRIICDQKALDFAVDSPHGTWTCVLSLHGDLGLVFYSCLQQAVPSEQRTKMALFLTLLNNDRLFGNFEMDLKTGDVRFKTYVDCEGSELTEQMIDRTMLLNVTTMQKYLPQLQQVLQS
jgi:hypothetical protein